MKFTADRAELAEAVKWVAGAISPKPSQPALGGIQIEAQADMLRLTAHNYDQVHTAHVDAEIPRDGTVVPAGFMVRDLLGALRTDKVTVEADDRRLTIKGGRSTYGVNLFQGWPEFPTGDAIHCGTVEADDLRAAIAVANAGVDDSHPNLAYIGVRLEAEGAELTLVGIDGVCLSVAPAPYAGAPFNARLPIKNLSEAARGLSGRVEISASGGILTLADARRSVTLRLYDWSAAPWRALLGEREHHLEVDADELRGAVRRAGLAGGKDSNIVLTADSGQLVITGAGDEADGVEVIDFDGNATWTAKFGAAGLNTVLATLPSTPVTLLFGVPVGGKPNLAITDKAGSFHHVMQPRKADS